MGVIYGQNLALCSTFIEHDGMSHVAAVTYAVAFDDPPSITPAEVATVFQGFFTDNWAARLDNAARITKTTVLIGDGTEEFQTGESTVAPTAGTSAHDSPPPQVCILVKKLTNFGGRLNRGRVYMPWVLAEDNIAEDGGFGGSTLTALQAAADGWLDDLDGTGFHPVIANRNYDRAWNIPGRKLESVLAGNQVTAMLVEGVVATQRRRLVR